MYISPVERMKKVHIWIGYYSGDIKEYDEYFNPKKSPCRFCKDIGIEEYDDDFIGIIPLLSHEANIQTLLFEVPIDEGEKTSILKRCERLGIQKGNAIFYLTDSTIHIKVTKKTYNGLLYIGVYNSSL